MRRLAFTNPTLQYLYFHTFLLLSTAPVSCHYDISVSSLITYDRANLKVEAYHESAGRTAVNIDITGAARYRNVLLEGNDIEDWVCVVTVSDMAEEHGWTQLGVTDTDSGTDSPCYCCHIVR